MESVTGLIMTTNILFKWPSTLPGYRKLKQLGIAKREFPMQTEILLNQERQHIWNKKVSSGRSNIMNQLLQAS